MKNMTDSTDNSPQETNAKKKDKKPGIIRKAAVIPILFISISSWVFLHFFFDSILASTLQKSAEALYGSTVDINNLKTTLTQGAIKIGSLAFSDKKTSRITKLR